MNFNEHKHVVVIYPHPDDESFGTAGTITKFREADVPVTYLCGTLGEMGRNMGNPFFANRETLPEIRKKELQEACRILDMDLVMLGLRDKTIEFESRDEIAERLKKYIEDLGATLVITFYPPYAVHPDHNALGAAAFEAVKRIEKNRRPELWANAIIANREDYIGAPDIVVDTIDVFDTKVKALEAHRSQVEGMLSKLLDGEKSEDQKERILSRFQYETYYRVDVDEVEF
ncbi:bacillithiol biosynthesis deacetylase BshB2 [Bacillaceae bacterium W0354]